MNIENELSESRFQNLLPQGLQFIEETRKFFLSKADQISLLDKMNQFTAESGIFQSEESMLQLRQRLRNMIPETRKQWITDSAIIGTSAYNDIHRYDTLGVILLAHCYTSALSHLYTFEAITM